jgi:hypothetical protein
MRIYFLSSTVDVPGETVINFKLKSVMNWVYD